MPAKETESYQNIFNVLRNLDIFETSGDLRKEGDKVWTNAFKKLNIKKHNLYMMIQQDRKTKDMEFGILTQLRNYNRIKVTEKAILLSDTIENSLNENLPIIVKEVISMKKSYTFDGSLLQIFPRPLTVIYCLPEQINFWKELVKCNVTSFTFTVLNELVDSVISLDSYIRNIYVYRITVKVDQHIFTIFQCISEETGEDFLKFFLREFLRNCLKPPTCINTGFSCKLFNTLSYVFNECSFNEHNIKCISHLVNGTSLPNVMMHSSIFELLYFVDKWKSLTNECIKKFCFHLIILLSSIKYFELFKEYVEKMFILFLSEYENNFSEMIYSEFCHELSNCANIRNTYENYFQVKENLKQFSLLELFEETDNLVESESVDNENLTSFFHILKFQALKKIEKLAINCESRNSYFSLHFVEDFEKLLYIFPVWTNIFCTENDQNSQVFHFQNFTQEKKTVPNFIEHDHNNLKDLCSFGRNFIVRLKKSNLKYKEIDNISSFSDYLSYEENWMNKNHNEKEKILLNKANDNELLKPTNLTKTIGEKIVKNVTSENKKNLAIFSDKDEPFNLINELRGNSYVINEFSIKDDDDYDKLNTSHNHVDLNLNIDCLQKGIYPQNSASSVEIDCNISSLLRSSLVDNQPNYLMKRPEIKIVNTTASESMNQDNDLFNLDCSEEVIPLQESASSVEMDLNISSLLHSTLIDNSHNVSKEKVELAVNTKKLYSKNVNDVELSVATINFANKQNNCKDDKGFNSVDKTPILLNITPEHNYSFDSKKIETKCVRNRKYVGPFQALDTCYTEHNGGVKISTGPKDTIVTNASKLEPRTIFGTTYSINNSSTFDALAESFIYAYRYYNTFREVCNIKVENNLGRDNDFLVAIVQFVKNAKNIYNLRALLLYYYATKTNNTIKIDDSIGCFLIKIMYDNYSFRIGMECQSCRFSTVLLGKVVVLSDLQKYVHVKNLKEYINDYFVNHSSKICGKCKISNFTINVNVEMYLVVDVEKLSFFDFVHALVEI